MEAEAATPTQGDVIDLSQIKRMIPHRYPMLMIEKIVDVVRDSHAIGIKNVSINEWFFQGHFPAEPVMPGVLIIEAMAQAAALLSFKSTGVKPDDNSVVYFAGIDNARFKRPVVPGDQLIFDVEITHAKRNIYKYKARASVDGELAAEAELMCAIKTL